MKIFKNVNHFTSSKPVVLTMGMYDGIHIGHKSILDFLVKEATQVGGYSVLLTYYPHPKYVLDQNSPLKLLNTDQEKNTQLIDSTIDSVIYQPFTKEFSALSAEAYIEKYLIEKLQVHTLIVGYDHHFGNDRKGNYDLLKKYADKGAFNLIKIEAQIYDQWTVSSTKIRQQITNGEIHLANELLGYHYTLTGFVVSGQKIGRTLGYPTANLLLHPDKLIPKQGVYAVYISIHGEKYEGVLNIGNRPSVNGLMETVEVYVFSFDDNLYHQEIQVELVAYLREEKKFDHLQQLKDQIAEDCLTAKNIFLDVR